MGDISLVRRFIALVADSGVPTLVGIATGWLIFAAAGVSTTGGLETLGAWLGAVMIGAGVYLAAAVTVDLLPLWTGQTPGERLVGVAPRRVTLGSAALRFVLRQALFGVTVVGPGVLGDLALQTDAGVGVLVGIVAVVYLGVAYGDLLDRAAMIRPGGPQRMWRDAPPPAS